MGTWLPETCREKKKHTWKIMLQVGYLKGVIGGSSHYVTIGLSFVITMPQYEVSILRDRVEIPGLLSGHLYYCRHIYNPAFCNMLKAFSFLFPNRDFFCFFSQEVHFNSLDPVSSARCLERFKSRTRSYSWRCWIRCATCSLWER
jgi:hypothetical protein